MSKNKFSNKENAYALLKCRARHLTKGNLLYGLFNGIQPDGIHTLFAPINPKAKKSAWDEFPIIPSTLERICPFPDMLNNDLYEYDNVLYKNITVCVEYDYDRHLWVITKMGEVIKDLEESDTQWLKLKK